MIKITRLNRTPLIVNSDLIEHIEGNPDTVITLTSGQKYVVLETIEEVVERVIAFRKLLFPENLRNAIIPPVVTTPRGVLAETATYGR